MLKKFSLSTILQIAYCICCGLVVIVMNLYSAFYDSNFGYTCFQIGAVLTLICGLNPIGLLCGVWQLVRYLSDRRNGEPTGKGQLAWVILGPMLTTACWFFAINIFVLHSGGV